MSAKFLKALALGHCTVENVSRSEVMIYWKEPRGKLVHKCIRPGQRVNLLQEASIPQLRKSINLKELFNRRLLRIVQPSQEK